MSSPTPLRLLSTLGVAGAMREITARCETAAGAPIDADFAPTVGMLDRIREGERADLTILTAEGIAELTEQGLLDPASRTDLARSYIGIAVKAGAPHPDIGSAEAFRATLLAAPSIAYSRIGASGIAFAALIECLGIAEAVNAKSRIIPGGFTASLAASGEVALAVQQVSELMAVPGIEVVGKLPTELETVATFTAGIFHGAAQPEAAARLIRFLASAEVAGVLEKAGLEPTSPV
jgi:molybdate transport system substrate-binding protein